MATQRHRLDLENALTIRPVRTPDELAQVQRFRYQICIEECGQTHLEGTNHQTKRIEDSLDHDLTVFSVFRGGELVGTVRWGLLSWTKRPHRHTTKLGALGFDNPEQLGITDRLVLAPSVRSLRALRALFKTVGTHALFSGSVYEFCWASPRLSLLYARLGYRSTGAEVTNDAGHQLSILQLDLRHPTAMHRTTAAFSGAKSFPSFATQAA